MLKLGMMEESKQFFPVCLMQYYSIVFDFTCKYQNKIENFTNLFSLFICFPFITEKDQLFTEQFSFIRKENILLQKHNHSDRLALQRKTTTSFERRNSTQIN